MSPEKRLDAALSSIRNLMPVIKNSTCDALFLFQRAWGWGFRIRTAEAVTVAHCAQVSGTGGLRDEHQEGVDCMSGFGDGHCLLAIGRLASRNIGQPGVAARDREPCPIRENEAEGEGVYDGAQGDGKNEKAPHGQASQGPDGA
jgi:hypothetical protein